MLRAERLSYEIWDLMAFGDLVLAGFCAVSDVEALCAVGGLKP